MFRNIAAHLVGASAALFVLFVSIQVEAAPQPSDPYNHPCLQRWFMLENLEYELMEAATRAIELAEAGLPWYQAYLQAQAIQDQLDALMPGYIDDCVDI